MTVPSRPQFAAGGFISAPAEHFAVGVIRTAETSSRFAQRLDRLDEELTKAHTEVIALAQRLTPVLPPEFQNASGPDAKLASDIVGAPASPLGERLASATERAFALVHQVRAVCEAVDL